MVVPLKPRVEDGGPRGAPYEQRQLQQQGRQRIGPEKSALTTTLLAGLINIQTSTVNGRPI
jgi:hypothetical protein